MNKVIAICAVCIAVGGVINTVGFSKGMLGISVIGITIMRTFSIMNISERISEIEKKLEKKSIK